MTNLNLKQDLLEELMRDKKFLELELGTYYSNSTMNYKDKLTLINSTLEKLALNDLKLQLVNHYFQENNEEVNKPNNSINQSHVE
jgi:hypothetical protein